MRIAAFLTSLIWILTCQGQPQVASYPQGYFRNPLGIPMSLSANYGELRPNHWHMGLDIRTERKVNLPVYAAAEGFVASIGIRPLSFGRFIVIDHPNGLSTLYAHLNSFFPALENYVEKKQKEMESWAIELEFDEDQFPVKRGQLIALSGNTGGSQGPHLHFEIRDTRTGNSLNPLLFGFGIRDVIPPVISRLALYDRNISTYAQSPQLIPVKKTNGIYTIAKKELVTGLDRISFAIGAYDKVNASSSPEGIYSATIFLDDQPVGSFAIDDFDYEQSVYVNSHIDHRYKVATGHYLQHLARLPGDRGPVYKEPGVIHFKDTNLHSIRIEVMDAYENKSVLEFDIRYSDSLAHLISRKIIPGKKLIPGEVSIFETGDFELHVPENSIYDTVVLNYRRQNNTARDAVSAEHIINDPAIPVHEDFRIRIRPSVSIAPSHRNKVLLVREWGSKRNVRNAVWQQDWLTASFGDFGKFRAYLDLVPPRVNAPAKGGDTLNLSALNRIVFTPTDNFGIRSFRAELDGQWLKFSNDKGRSHIYYFDEQCPYGVHQLKVRVEDIAGNITEQSWWFRRHPYTPKKKVIKKKRKR